MPPDGPPSAPAQTAAGPAPALRPPATAAGAQPALTARWRAALLALLAAMVVLGLAWELVLAPTGSGTLALKVLPLALALPGLLRRQLRTARWLSLLVWLYFIEAVVRAWGDRGLSQALALAWLALTLALFGAAVGAVRAATREQRAAAGTARRGSPPSAAASPGVAPSAAAVRPGVPS